MLIIVFWASDGGSGSGSGTNDTGADTDSLGRLQELSMAFARQFVLSLASVAIVSESLSLSV